MSVHIKHVHVTRGPLEKFKKDLGLFTVVYGPNQSGKTSLEEGMLMALCPKKDWKWMGIRDKDFPDGKIGVRVDIDGESKTFNKSDKKKLLDTLAIDGGEYSLLPLYVKGSQTSLGKGGPLTQTDLEEILRIKKIYEHIDSRIDATIKNGSVHYENGNVVGSKTIKYVKESEHCDEVLRSNRKYLEDLEKIVSEGTFNELQNEKRELETRLYELEMAKRHKAFSLSHTIAKHESIISSHEKERLDSLLKDINYITRSQKGNAAAPFIKEKNMLESNLEWIEGALSTIGDYKDRIGDTDDPTRKILYCSAATGLVTVALTVIAETVVFALLGLVSSALAAYGAKTHGRTRKSKEMETMMESISRGIKSNICDNPLFNDAYENSPVEVTLMALKESVKSRISALDGSISTCENESKNIQSIKDDLSCSFSRESIPYTGSVETDARVVAALIKEIDTSEKEAAILRKELELLGVKRKDHLETWKGCEYDQANYVDVRDSLRDIIGRMDEIEKEKGHLLGNPPSGKKAQSFSEAVFSANTAIADASAEKKKIHARLIAQSICGKILSERNEHVHKEINRILSSTQFSSLLFSFTSTYDSIRIGDDKNVYIVEKESNEEHLFSHISSGAMEQACMAMRIALAHRIYENRPMFMILDDAFIFSDDAGRDSMISALNYLLENDWQIIYLTKDHATRDVLEGAFGSTGDFKRIDLDMQSSL